MRPIKLIFLLSILAVAALLRLGGIRFGEPLAVHPTEAQLLEQALSASSRYGNPGDFTKPSGLAYLTLLMQGLHYLCGNTQSPLEFWRGLRSSPFEYHLWTRFLVAVFGVLGVFAVWLLGREWDRGRTQMRILGWGAAGLLAVHFLHMRDSHFATNDIPLTTCITLALWLLLREFHRESTNVIRLLLVALWIGVSCGIGYRAAVLVIPLLYVGYDNAMRGKEVSISLSWLIGSAAVLLATVMVGFFLTTPYALIDTSRFWSDLGQLWFSAPAYETLRGGEEPFFLGYIQGPWMWGGGMGLAVFSFFGLMMALLRHEAEDKVLLCFALPFLLLISFQQVVKGHLFLPLVPLQILWAVRFIAVYASHPWAVETASRSFRHSIAGGIILLLAVESGLPAARLVHLLRQPDTRAEARTKISLLLSPQDVILTTPFCPPLPAGVQKRVESQLLAQPPQSASQAMTIPGLGSLSEMEEEGLTGVLISSFYWEAVNRGSGQRFQPGMETYRTFLSEVKSRGSLVFEISAVSPDLALHPEDIYAPTFNLWKWTRPGPNLLFYRLPVD